VFTHRHPAELTISMRIRRTKASDPDVSSRHAGHHLFFCLVSFLVFAAQVRAQSLDPSRRISQYGHTTWRTQDGVVSVFTPITQTADGYVWMAAPGLDSIVRFDGVRFVPWRPSTGPFPSKVNFLLGARDGSLWIGTRGGLGRLKDGVFSNYSRPSDKSGVNEMLEDHQGTIWFTRYRIPPGEGALCKMEDSGPHCYGPSDGLAAGFALGLTEDPEGYLWFAAESLYRWKPGTQPTRYFESTSHPQLASVVADRAGNIWATMDEAGKNLGVRYFHDGVWGEYSTPDFHSSTLKSEALFVDRGGSVWIGTDDDGLYRIVDGSVDHFSTNDGLTGRGVSGFYEDREGNLWVATDGGVDLFRNTPVTTYSMDEGLSSGAVPTVLAASDGTVWAGKADKSGGKMATFADVLLPGPRHRFSSGPSFPGRIAAMLQDRSGALWFGLESKHLIVYDDGKVDDVLAQDGRLVEDQVLALVHEKSGDILALTPDRILRINHRRVVEAIPLPRHLAESGYLSENPTGGTWVVGKDEGVMLYRDGALNDLALPISTKPVKINAVVADSLDPLLLATTDGLSRWNGDHWDTLNETTSLPCNHLLEAIKDKHGALWLEANCGLLKIEASDLEAWRQSSESRPSFTLFDPRDGVRPPGRSYSFEPTASLGPDGKVWFAAGGAIQSIDPDHLNRNLLPPPVRVEQLIADGKSFAPDATATLPPNTHNLEIDYTALSFSVPQKVFFRYFLEGYDKSWLGPVTRRQAFYTNLAPGTYRFHVTACNDSGVWNETGTLTTFVIEPTFYQTTLFRSLVAVACIGALWAVYLLRMRQATANVQRRLLAQIEERERIARELHDTLLQGFQGITLRVQGVAKRLPAQDPLRHMIDEVLDRADGLLREARQRVRKLRRRATDINDLPARLAKYGEELAKEHDAAFSLAIVGDPRVLEPTVEDEASRIMGEAMTNAFRHASASKIETEVTYDSSALRMRVRDDGVGIQRTVLASGFPGHFGLIGMRERSRALRSELNIWSREAAGTEVELVIPASIAYPRE